MKSGKKLFRRKKNEQEELLKKQKHENEDKERKRKTPNILEQLKKMRNT